MTRNTLQRQIILDTIKALDTHPTAEDLYREIQKKYPTIGMATIYRNLRQLAKNGLIVQIATLGDAARYDGCAYPHYHFHCKECGGTFDLEMDLIDGIENAIESKYGFQVDGHDISFTGVCLKCTSSRGQR